MVSSFAPGSLAELMTATPDAYRPELVSAAQIEQHLAELDGRWFSEDNAVFGMAQELAERHPNVDRRAWWHMRIGQRWHDLQAEYARRREESLRFEAEYNARQKAERRAQRKAERQAAKQATAAPTPEPTQPPAPAQTAPKPRPNRAQNTTNYIAAHVADRTAYREQARAHFRALFGDQCGWLELSSIEGDPDDRQRCRFHQSWFDYAPDRLEALIARIAELVKRHGNVYTSITLYAAPKRDKAQALPGRVVFVDDAPPGSYTYTLKTSPDREQAFIILDQAADVSSRETIARRFSRTADKSGWDITQLARVPGTFNTKARAGGRYGRGPRDWAIGSGHRVTLIPRTLRTYTLAELGKVAPALPAEASAFDSNAIDEPKVAFWSANLDALIGADGLPKRLSPKSKTRQILAGGLQWNDSSAQRYAVARGLIMHGYPDEEIAALLIHFCDYGKSTAKGSRWLYEDIARVLGKERAKQPGIVTNPTVIRDAKPAEPLPTTPRKSRARRDRPQRYTPATLFASYRDTPALCEQARKQRAADLGISTATLDRLEKALRVLGLIDIECQGRGHSGRVTLVGVINITSEGVLSGATNEAADLGIAAQQTTESSPQCIGETHPPEVPEVVAATPWRLADVVRAAFDRVRVDHETGERRTVTRRRLLIALGPLTYSDTALDEAIADERQRRRIAGIVADIRTMKPPTLRAQLRLMERLSDKSRAEGTNLHKFTDWAARELRQALASLPSTGRKPRPICEALPDLRAAGAAHRAQIEQREQAELWAAVDRELAQRMPSPARAATRAGVCSSQTAQTVQPAGIVARLRDLKAQRL